jgi:aminoglycoside 6'-N-acetyltransferase
MGTLGHDHPVLHRDDLVLRPSTEDDVDVLARWFADPEVFRWWGGHPLTRSVVAAKYAGRRCPRVESFIVELARSPIGYIQYHLEGPGQAGLDMMLLPEFRGRGIGPAAARILIAHLRSARGWTDITVDPARDNARAIRGWEKAGFTTEREWPDHPDGPALLMRLMPRDRDTADTATPA